MAEKHKKSKHEDKNKKDIKLPSGLLDELNQRTNNEKAEASGTTENKKKDKKEKHKDTKKSQPAMINDKPVYAFMDELKGTFKDVTKISGAHSKPSAQAGGKGKVDSKEIKQFQTQIEAHFATIINENSQICNFTKGDGFLKISRAYLEVMNKSNQLLDRIYYGEILNISLKSKTNQTKLKLSFKTHRKQIELYLDGLNRVNFENYLIPKAIYETIEFLELEKLTKEVDKITKKRNAEIPVNKDIIIEREKQLFKELFGLHNNNDLNYFGTRYKMLRDESGQYEFNMESEMERVLGGDLNLFQKIRNYVDFEKEHAQYCITYPKTVYIAKGLVIEPDEEESKRRLRKAASFREKERFPALCWYNRSDGRKKPCCLYRSSQPKSGITGRKDSADDQLLHLMGYRNENDLVVVDARSNLAAFANRGRGGGTEKDAQHENIDNIHDLRNSLTAILNENKDKQKSILIQKYYDNWIKRIFASVADITKKIQLMDNNVLIHCSSGWDRTPQLTALSMLHLDSHYRTIKGFADLIEKEWIAFGHQFGMRYAAYSEEKNSELSPVFLQFLHCVSICLKTHRTQFEFNENLLRFIAKNVYSLHYYNFLFGNERHRYFAKKYFPSIWNDVFKLENGNRVRVLGDYKNERYVEAPGYIEVQYEDNDETKENLWEGYGYGY